MRRLSIKRRVSVVVHVTGILRIPVNWWLGVDLFRLRLRLKLLLLLLKNTIFTKIFLKKKDYGVNMTHIIVLRSIWVLRLIWVSRSNLVFESKFQKILFRSISFWVRMHFGVKKSIWDKWVFGSKWVFWSKYVFEPRCVLRSKW